MKGLKVLTLLALVLLLMSTAIGASTDPKPLYEYADSYTYWSRVSDGVCWWAVRNERTDATLTGWTTGAGYAIGTIPGAAILPEARFPLPVVDPHLPRPWFNAFFTSDKTAVIVESTLWWSDSTSARVQIYMPLDAPVPTMRAASIPEPSGILALALSLSGLVTGFGAKKRSDGACIESHSRPDRVWSKPTRIPRAVEV